MPVQDINASSIETYKNEIVQQQISHNDLNGRSESQTSSHSSGSTNIEICRICHCEGDVEASLIAPCYCSGSLRYVHQVCLQQWIKSSNTRCCELCRFQFIMHTKTKPFTEWELLEMDGFERRKLLCAVMFHAIAVTCVVWSLYVLIDRTAEEIKKGILEWPFWTKLIVVAIGCTGGVVFMYIQCKAYFHICQRWKAYNRVIYVQNAPEKQPLSGSRVSTAQASKQSSSDYHTSIDSSKPYPESNSSKDETSIDLKGVRNVHIFFKDENQVCVQNDQPKEEGEGGAEGHSSNQRQDDTAMWHIKIGKSLPNDSSSSRCNENDIGDQRPSDVKIVPSGEDQHSVARGQEQGDSVLKLQIKKAEIVIKFGQSSAQNTESGHEDPSHLDSKDTSVNIKIDDKERGDPIVIDLMKKAPTTSVEPKKDPLKICFDFGDRGCESDESTSADLLEVKSRDPTCPNEAYHSGTDSGSQSPLLVKKNVKSPCQD